MSHCLFHFNRNERKCTINIVYNSHFWTTDVLLCCCRQVNTIVTRETTISGGMGANSGRFCPHVDVGIFVLGGVFLNVISENNLLEIQRNLKNTRKEMFLFLLFKNL